ncbi:hypothetical protein DFH29DRAFT_197033 [Suillus ampliporus]|nr:hypothetical protein DFH29DRAFT_197033 [Suillus ampliporus]
MLSTGIGVHMHSRSARSIIITAIALLLPTTQPQSARSLLLLRDLGFCLGGGRSLRGRRLGAFTLSTLGGWGWCRGCRSTTSGGSACASAMIPANSLSFPCWSGHRVLFAQEKKYERGLVVIAVVEGSTDKTTFIALAQPCPHLRQNSYRFSWNDPGDRQLRSSIQFRNYQ